MTHVDGVLLPRNPVRPPFPGAGPPFVDSSIVAPRTQGQDFGAGHLADQLRHVRLRRSRPNGPCGGETSGLNHT